MSAQSKPEAATAQTTTARPDAADPHGDVSVDDLELADELTGAGAAPRRRPTRPSTRCDSETTP